MNPNQAPASTESHEDPIRASVEAADRLLAAMAKHDQEKAATAEKPKEPAPYETSVGIIPGTTEVPIVNVPDKPRTRGKTQPQQTEQLFDAEPIATSQTSKPVAKPIRGGMAATADMGRVPKSQLDWVRGEGVVSDKDKAGERRVDSEAS